jgi:hypothetical protein
MICNHFSVHSFSEHHQLSMKHYVVFLFLLCPALCKAQIKLEHIYPPVNNPANSIIDNLSLAEVDSGLWKYIYYNGRDSIFIYDLNHSFDHSFTIPEEMTLQWDHPLAFFSKKLFDLDDKYEYMLIDNFAKIKVYQEDGTVVFSCEDCHFQNLVNSPDGVKMLIGYGYEGQTGIFSLPGKIPGSANIARSGVNTPSIKDNSSLPTIAYPNPSDGQIRIEYQLPDGIAIGEIIITNDLGKEIRKFRVGNMFHDIIIQKSDLPSGIYFYKVVTSRGESEVKKIVVAK